ncbi:MAG: hypothetical protein NVSMB6_14620 [Burkholderiaceae bacterium]
MKRHFAIRRAVHVLGFAGLIPFIVLAAACWLIRADLQSFVIAAQLSYAVAILSFLGGIHWGAALLCGELSVNHGRIGLLWGVMPSLVSVAALQFPSMFALTLLIAAFLTVYLVDKRLYPWYRMPDWLPALRFRLTCVVAVTLGLTLAAVIFRS